MNRGACFSIIAGLAFATAGCTEIQSVLHPTGPGAASTYVLTLVLFFGGAAIFVVVAISAWLAIFGSDTQRKLLSGERAVMLGGIAFPAVTLTALLIYGSLLARANTPPEDGDVLQIAVEGRQWWWRVTYVSGDGAKVESANEIRVPAGRRVEVALTSPDVIHSFWVPNLAGKIDLIPGRTTHLSFTADKPGTSRGQCAEFCGGPHGLMSFRVVAMAPDDFAQWMTKEQRPAAAALNDANVARGAELFNAAGCGACHTVRGSSVATTIGPDLTHAGGRQAIGAEVLPMTKANFKRWITSNQELKPGNPMPPFRNFSGSELDDLASYLEALK